MRTPALWLHALGAGLAVRVAVLALLPRHDAPPPELALAPGTEPAPTAVPARDAAAPSAPSTKRT